MLNNAPVYVMIRIKDHKITNDFYVNKLGLTHRDLGPKVPAIFEAGNGTRILAYSGEPTHPENTVGSFVVNDIESTVKDLKAKSVAFEEYEMPGMTMENSIITTPSGKSAWFKDPDGYIFALNQTNIPLE